MLRYLYAIPLLFLLFLSTLLSATPSNTLSTDEDCRMQDSLVLVNLYQATNANGWTNDWDLNQPMDTWYGVELNVDGCVEVLDLDSNDSCFFCTSNGNNLTGEIPKKLSKNQKGEFTCCLL